MPFKSKAQRRKFAQLLVKGEISPETFEEWNRETGGEKLPEYVDARKGKKTKKNTKTKRKAALKRKKAPAGSRGKATARAKTRRTK